MAGTDHRRRAVAGGPAIILVEPQLGENIGTTARAMMNVHSRFAAGAAARRLAVGQSDRCGERRRCRARDRARLYPSIRAAHPHLVHVYAATARDRGMVRREVTPRHAAGEMRARGWRPAKRAACCSGLSAPGS